MCAGAQRKVSLSLDLAFDLSYCRSVVGPAQKPSRRADRWARGLLLALLGMVLGTTAVLLLGPRPCPYGVRVPALASSGLESADEEGDEDADDAPMEALGGSVADDTWGSLGP